MSENSQIILHRILDLITEKGWSKKKFAEVCDIYPQHVNSYLDGTFGFENLLEGLAREGVDVNYILTGEINKGAGTMGVNEELAEYRTNFEERLSRIEGELEKVKARNYDLIEECKQKDQQIAVLWEAVKELGLENQVLRIFNSKINPGNQDALNTS